jgi:hypothetical protein
MTTLLMDLSLILLAETRLPMDRPGIRVYTDVTSVPRVV